MVQAGVGWPEGGACLLLPSPSEVESPSLSRKKVATATPSFPNKYQLGRITSGGQSAWNARLYCSVARIAGSFTASFSVTRNGVYVCLHLCAITTGQSLVDSYRCLPKVTLFYFNYYYYYSEEKKKREKDVHVGTLFDGARKHPSRRPDQTARRVSVHTKITAFARLPRPPSSPPEP